jgi:hypothetical protein
MTVKIGTALRNVLADGAVDRLDGGTFILRSGSVPANPATAASGTLLATCTFGTPAFGSASVGVATANSVSPESSIDATGTAGYFRILTSAAVVDWQGSAGEAAEDVVLNDADLVIGGQVSIISMTVTMPES